MGFQINAGTRAEALAEGGLVDASELAKEAFAKQGETKQPARGNPPPLGR